MFFFCFWWFVYVDSDKKFGFSFVYKFICVCLRLQRIVRVIFVNDFGVGYNCDVDIGCFVNSCDSLGYQFDI